MTKTNSSDIYTSDKKRWTAQRKLEILRAFEIGKITQADLAKHAISLEEINEWKSLHDLYGKRALRTTKLQHFRK